MNDNETIARIRISGQSKIIVVTRLVKKMGLKTDEFVKVRIEKIPDDDYFLQNDLLNVRTSKTDDHGNDQGGNQ